MALPNVNTSPPINGFGQIAATAASVAVSTLTANAQGAAYPGATAEYPNQTLTITNSGGSAGVAFFCPFGGTASSTAGIPISVGATRVFNMGNIKAGTPTVIAATTATLEFEW